MKVHVYSLYVTMKVQVYTLVIRLRSKTLTEADFEQKGNKNITHQIY